MRFRTPSLTLAWSLFATAPAVAQVAPPVWLLAHGDTVTIQLAQVPEPFYGFHLYRSSLAGSFERVDEVAVTPSVGIDAVLAVVGSDAPLLEDLTRSATSTQMVRRVTSDPVTASVYSYLFPSVATALGRRYVDTAPTAGERYRYRVVFLDAEGEERGDAREADVEVYDVLPGTPTELAATTDVDAVTLTWRYPEYTGAADDFVVGFHVYRRAETGIGGVPAPSLPRTAGSVVDDAGFERVTDVPVARDDLAALTWVDRTARSGAASTYRVRAVDLIGREGAASAPVEVSLSESRPPSAPVALVAVPAEGRVRLAWRIPPDLTVVGYRVERSLGLDLPFESRTDALIAAADPQWIDEEVVGGTQYFYRVVAVDAAGRESSPGNPVGAIPFDNRPPSAPADLRATWVDGAVRIQWAPPLDTDLLGYHLYRRESGGSPVRLTPEPLAEVAFTDRGFDESGFVPGRSYRFGVTALDDLLNESEAAEVEIVVPDDQAPAAPTGLTASVEAGRDVVVRWSPAPDLDVARYVVMRTGGVSGTASAPGAANSAVDWIPLDTVSATGPLRFRDTTAEAGVEYRYRVSAVDAAGNEGVAAEADVVLRDDVRPAPPGPVEVALADGGVWVQWGRVVARDLAAYRVYRATTPTGAGTPVGGPVPPGAELRIWDPSGTEAHFYRVVAVDTSGNESRPSDAVRPGGWR